MTVFRHILEARRSAQHRLNSCCDIFEVVTVHDTRGNVRGEERFRAKSVPCRLQGEGRAQGQDANASTTTETGWMLRLPVGTEVRVNDHVRLYGQSGCFLGVYTVKGEDAGREDAILLQVRVERTQYGAE